MNNLAKKPKPSLYVLGSLIVFFIGLDQSTKLIFESWLDYNQAVVVTPFFNLRLIYNSGVAFSFFAGGGEIVRIALTFFSFAFAFGAGFFLKQSQTFLERVALALLIAGALGNGIDRLVYGYVIDFLDFHFLGYHWPTFNVADSAVSVGAVILLLTFFKK